MPYNYLIDERIRESFKIDMANCIIIFDEGHNLPPSQEEINSFEIKCKSLQMCLTELRSLQEVFEFNKKKEQHSTVEGIQRLKEFTQNFHDYLKNFDLNPLQNPDAIVVQDRKYLPPSSLVLPGRAIFKIFEQGTQQDELSKTGDVVGTNLKESYYEHVKPAFDDALMDIADMGTEKQITYLEGWAATVQKVMDLWSSGDARKEVSDADDFYVFLYDEEDKDKYRQQKFKPKGKKASTSMVDDNLRVLGFWCFNAGVGFKKLEKLQPRSLIITSGTLSPMQSFEAELAVKFKHQVENPHVIDPK